MVMPFLLQRRLELLIVGQVLFLAQVVEPPLELLVAQVIALFLTHLKEQELVDGVDQQLRCHLVDCLLQLGAVVDHVRLEVHTHALADGGGLPLFELGLA